MPKRTLIELGQFTLEEFKQTFVEEKTILKTAKKLGVNRRTVRRMLDRYGLQVPPVGKPVGSRQPHHSAILKWVREHPDEKLPRSVKRISDLTGVSQNKIKTYLYRQRKRAKNAIRSLPDLRKLNAKFRAPNGFVVPFRYIDHYEVLFDPWRLTYKLRMKIHGSGKMHVFRLKTLKPILSSCQSERKSKRETPA